MSERSTTVLGPIPSEWEAKTIGELAAHVGSGITPTGGSDVYTDSGVTFIRSQNVTNDGLLLDDVAFIDKKTHDRMKGSEVVAFDVLLNITGASIGRCCFLPSGLGQTNVNQHVCSIRLPTPSQADAKYLSSVLASPIGQNQIYRLNAGGNREGLNYQQLRVFRIPWPPKECRAGIARILTTLDNLIEKTERLIAKYQAIKQGMMHDLFTRGVDTHGHLRPPQPEAPDLYKQSELGWIPKAWDLVPASELCHEITKGSTPSDLFAEDGPGRVPFIRVQNLSFDGTLLFDAERAYILESVHSTSLVRSRVFPGDVLMNLVGPPMGKVSLIPDKHPEWNINQAIAIFRTLDKSFTRFFLHFLLSRGAYHWFLSRAKKTSGQQNLTLEMCRQLPVPKPRNRDELDRIAARLRSADEMLGVESASLNKLRQLKTGLMQDLLTGKVRVKLDEAEEVAAHA